MKILSSIALAGVTAAVVIGYGAIPKVRGSFTDLPSTLTTIAQTPASMEEFVIMSHGSRMNGLAYLASGDGLKPVVVFLHGYPGNEKNLDLAQAVRRAGYHAVYFEYRGVWGSAGTFGFGNGLEDLQAALAWIRNADNARKYRFDTSRITLVGHSFGGWLTLMSAGREPASVCAVAIAAWNIGQTGKNYGKNTAADVADMAYYRSTTEPGGPVHAVAEQLKKEIVDHKNDYDYLTKAATFGNRPTLLIATPQDGVDGDVAMHQRIATALRAAGNQRVTMVQYDDDHPFSSHRTELAAELTRWLGDDCAKAQGKR